MSAIICIFAYPGMPAVVAELQQKYTTFKINTLCVRNESNAKIKVVCFKQAAPLSNFAQPFCEIGHSIIFHTAWVARVNLMAENAALNIKDLELEVWTPVFKWCQQLLNMLQDLSLKLGEVDAHFKGYETKELATQLKILFHGINKCINVQLSDYWIDESVKKIAVYRELCDYRDAANSFLDLRNFLHLSEGDFSDIERISNKVITLFVFYALLLLGCLYT